MKDRSLDRSAGLQIWRVISSAGCMERGACSPFIQQYINTDTHTPFLLLRASTYGMSQRSGSSPPRPP